MRIGAMGLALALSLAAPAWAAEPVEVRYDVYWGGFRAAEARFVLSGGDSELAVRATGLMEKLSAFVLEAEAQREQFRSHSRSKKMESVLGVDFQGRPRILIDEIRRLDPKDKPEPREKVPEALQVGTVDPLTAMVTTSRRALEGGMGQRFIVPVFDGRNRYDVTVTVLGPGQAQVAGRLVKGTRATLAFKPLAGFRPKSREMWDGATFTVLLDPATGLPARIASESFTVATVISQVPPGKTGG